MIVLFVSCKEDVPTKVISSMGICILLYQSLLVLPNNYEEDRSLLVSSYFVFVSNLRITGLIPKRTVFQISS